MALEKAWKTRGIFLLLCGQPADMQFNRDIRKRWGVHMHSVVHKNIDVHTLKLGNFCYHVPQHAWLIICPIAIAYSMGQIIKSVCVCVCVCLSVCLSVCEHSHGRISWSIFTKIGRDVRTPKSKNEFVGGSISHHPFPYVAPQNPHF